MRRWLTVLAVFVVLGCLGSIWLAPIKPSREQVFQQILHETTKNPFVENSACGKWFRLDEFVAFTAGDLKGSSYEVTPDSPRILYTEKVLAFAGQVLVERFGKNWEIVCRPNGPSSTDDALATARDYLVVAHPVGLENQLEVLEATRTIQRELNRRAGQYAETSHELLIQWMSRHGDFLKETSKKEEEELETIRRKRPAGWEKYLKK